MKQNDVGVLKNMCCKIWKNSQGSIFEETVTVKWNPLLFLKSPSWYPILLPFPPKDNSVERKPH